MRATYELIDECSGPKSKANNEARKNDKDFHLGKLFAQVLAAEDVK